MAKGKEVHQRISMWEDELVEDNFTFVQKLSLKIDSNNSCRSFSLETLAQHRVLIGHLQGEVDFPRRKGEALQQQLEKQETIQESLAQDRDTGI
jgi:hypothetical protein